jgi:DNA-binding SARP family transcriptional activator
MGLAKAPASPLYATLLGAFAVYQAQQPLQLGGSKLVLNLCQYLLGHIGQPVARDVLIDVFWPGVDPSAAVHRLHVAISSLRSVLDQTPESHSVVRLDDQSYWMAPGTVQTDCEAFERYYECGKVQLGLHEDADAAHSFRSALGYYSGDYLAQNLYAEWTFARRAHFAERRLTALTLLCERAADVGDLTMVIEYAHAILEVDSLRERAHRHLMRAHAALGQPACAIRQFNLCAEQLRRELGVAPAQLTQVLHAAIRAELTLPLEAPLLH